jgi:hypothetical protein
LKIDHITSNFAPCMQQFCMEVKNACRYPGSAPAPS